MIPIQFFGRDYIMPDSDVENIYLAMRVLFGDGEYPFGEEKQYIERVIYSTGPKIKIYINFTQ